MATTVSPRYARPSQMLGEANVLQLQGSTVILVGVGLLGGEILEKLNSLGVSVVIIDPGVVKEENVGHQGFAAHHVGWAKVDARAAQALESNPDARVRPLFARVEDVGLGVFLSADLIMAGVDNRAARVRLAEIATLVHIPLIDTALDGTGERLLGTVSLFDPRRPDAPCGACKYSADDLAAIRTEHRPQSCPDWRSTDVPATPPTLSTSPFAAVIAGFALTWAIKVLLDDCDSIANYKLQISADDQPSLQTLAMKRAPHCALPHHALAPIFSMGRGTIGDVVEAATGHLGSRPVAIRFHHRWFVRELICPITGEIRPLARLSHAFLDKELVSSSERDAKFVPSELLECLEPKDLWQLSSMSWDDLGLPGSDVVTAISKDGAEAHFAIGDFKQPQEECGREELRHE